MTELSKLTTLSWRKLLASEPGQIGMLFLRERIPAVVKGPADEMIFDAGRAEGFKQAIDTISELIAMDTPKEVNISND